MHPPQPMLFFEMSGQSLLKKIRKLTKWQDDKPRCIGGMKVPDKKAVVFALFTAQVTELPGLDAARDGFTRDAGDTE